MWKAKIYFLFMWFCILLHVPHYGVNNPLRKVFLGLTCFSFCSLLINFYYLGWVLLSYSHALLQSRFITVNARLRWVVILVFFHLFYAAWRGQVRLSSFSGRLWLSDYYLLCSRQKKKERNAVRQLVMNSMLYFICLVWVIPDLTRPQSCLSCLYSLIIY